LREQHVPAETYTFFGYSHDVQVLIFCNISLTFVCTGYIGEFEEIDDHRSGKIVVQLNGRLNKCGVISPRYNVKLGDLEKWVVKLLPARQFGYVILTTSAGIMDHEEGKSSVQVNLKKRRKSNKFSSSPQARLRQGHRLLLLSVELLEVSGRERLGICHEQKSNEL
jgi:small subunit ribosomal protein S15Ae